jgi:hypothetical protein
VLHFGNVRTTSLRRSTVTEGDSYWQEPHKDEQRVGMSHTGFTIILKLVTTNTSWSFVLDHVTDLVLSTLDVTTSPPLDLLVTGDTVRIQSRVTNCSTQVSVTMFSTVGSVTGTCEIISPVCTGRVVQAWF